MKLKHILLLSLLLITGVISAQKKLVILHTNDTHSRIEPLPDTDKYNPNDAGVVRRHAYIEEMRKENPNLILLDVGDFVQGTPYFNLFKGRVEAKAMNLLKYDATTLGNHEFDYGLDTLKRIVTELNFPVVNCNYDFSQTPLKGMIKPYIVIQKNGLKIGILGVGVDPEGLVEKNKYEGMVFNPIISSANKYAKILKEKEKCDLIICLSHIGYTSGNGVVNDVVLAQQTQNIDIILGGHSHTNMEKPDIQKNLDNKEVTIYQIGKSGIYVGRIDVEFEKTKK